MNMTRFATVAFCGVLAITSSRAGAAIAQGDMDELTEQLAADAASWQSGKPADSTSVRRLKSVNYDADSLGVLGKALNAGRKDPLNIYVGNKLLQPLLMAKPDVIAKALPIVRQFQASCGEYQQFPRLDERELAALQLSDSASPTQKETINKARDRKVAKDTAIAQHNEMLYQLDVTVFKLMIRTGDKAEDEALLTCLTDALEKGLWTYADVVECIRGESTTMSPERCKAYGLVLVDLGNKYRNVKKQITKMGQATVSPDKNSTFAVVDDYIGIRLLDTYNLLSTTAKLPAQKLPTKEQVDGAPPTRGPRPNKTGGATPTTPKTN